MLIPLTTLMAGLLIGYGISLFKLEVTVTNWDEWYSTEARPITDKDRDLIVWNGESVLFTDYPSFNAKGEAVTGYIRKRKILAYRQLPPPPKDI